MAQAESATSVTVACTRCGRTVTLPPAPDQPGFVLLAPLDGWEAGTESGRWYRLCPECLAPRAGDSRD